MNPNNDTISLSVEEIALCFSMINSPSHGLKFIKSIDKNITKEDLDARFKAASHSLVAHGFASIGENGFPQMKPELEKTLLPMVIYDKLIQILRSDKIGNRIISIYINNKNESFTAHEIKLGVVHNISCDQLENLTTYLLGLFKDFGSEKMVPFSEEKISLELMGKIGLAFNNPNVVKEFLDQSDLSNNLKNELSTDICEMAMRGSIFSIKHNPKDQDAGESTPLRGILLLRNGENHWLFHFDKIEKQQKAVIRKADKDLFEKYLEEIVNQD